MLNCQVFPRSGKTEWLLSLTVHQWWQAGCHGPQPCQPSSRSGQQQVQKAACHQEWGQPQTS